MKSRIFLLTLRAIFFLLCTGFILEKVKEHVFSRWGDPLPREIYGVLSVAIIVVVLGLSMRSLLAELRLHRASSERKVFKGDIVEEKHAESTHRFPVHLILIVSLLSLFMAALPFMMMFLGSFVTPFTYICSFSLAAMLFVMVVRLIIFSVTMKADRIVVRDFISREVYFDEIERTSIARTRNGQQIVVVLKSGKVLRFGGMLTGFRLLVAKVENTLSEYKR